MLIDGDKNGPKADNLTGTGGIDFIYGGKLGDRFYGAAELIICSAA